MRTFSFGGGVQSTAALVLAAEGKIDYRIFLFANVGDDSENPDTLLYVEQIAKPYAASQGLELIELRRTMRDGRQPTLLEHVIGDNKSVNIPVWLASGAPGNRNCTAHWKVDVIAQWQRKHGATKDDKAVCGLGISMDEVQRMRKESGIPTQVLEYPLIDLRLNRRDCMRIIHEAGLPVPPKSSCWFCPFHKKSEWIEMRRTKPEMFQKAVELEKRIIEKRANRDTHHTDPAYLHQSARPLEQAVGNQLSLFEDEPCDSGYCFV